MSDRVRIHIALTIIFILFILFILVTSIGCEEPESIAGADQLKVRTRPIHMTGQQKAAAFAFGVIRGRPDDYDVKLADSQGLYVLDAVEIFEADFSPEMLVSGTHFFSIKDDPIHFLTRMTFISRNVYKRTDIEYNHLLKLAGKPLLRVDAVMVTVGTIGVPKKGVCYLAILDLLGQHVTRTAPMGYTKEELEAGKVIPLAWEGRRIHAILVMQEGKAVYFVADDEGVVEGSVSLEGLYVFHDDEPSGWPVITTDGGGFLITFDKGYFLVDNESWDAEFFDFESPVKVLGVTGDSREMLTVEFDTDFNSPAVYRRNLADGDSGGPLPFGRENARQVMQNVMYAVNKDCIFYVDGGDIWRMDLHSGVQGKMFDTPGEEEVLLWAW